MVKPYPQLLQKKFSYFADDSTFIHFAALNNRYEITMILIKNDLINVSCVDCHGFTALIWASFRGYTTCVELLLQNNADVSLRKNGGYTALMFAEMRGYEGMVELLLHHNAYSGHLWIHGGGRLSVKISR